MYTGAVVLVALLSALVVLISRNTRTVKLDWAFGYPLAIVLMIVAAVIPYFYFKLKKWL